MTVAEGEWVDSTFGTRAAIGAGAVVGSAVGRGVEPPQLRLVMVEKTSMVKAAATQ